MTSLQPVGKAVAAGGSILDAVGRTQVVRLPRLGAAVGAELLGKVEYANPGGSLKDRVAAELVRDAEQRGQLAAGQTVVEATAGNTGIGLALVCAARGYPFVAVLTEADRGPKSDLMRALGAEVVFTSGGVPWDSEAGPLGVAARITKQRGGVFVDQFSNPANANAHQKTTGAEIVQDLGAAVDTVILGLGTGGTVTGVARALRAAGLRTRVVGVAAEGSYLGSLLAGDRIAGITPDFEPAVLDRTLLDEVVTVTADEAARHMRRINLEEGIPAGHSSGACLAAASREAERHRGSTILFLLGDSIRNYPGLMG